MSLTRSQTARAWVNFNGTGTVAIRDSFNVSSITDRGTGNYTVNFEQDMLTPFYVGLGSCKTWGRVNISVLAVESCNVDDRYSYRFCIPDT